MPSFDDVISLQCTDNDCYLGARSPDQADRMFGGFLIGQALAASQSTTDANRSVHSLHCYFLRPGDTSEQVEYAVTRIRDGRSFSHRQVIATQNGKEVFHMVCSYAVVSASPTYVGEKAPHVPPPQEIDYTYADFCRDQMPDPDYIRDVKNRPFEIKYINPPHRREPSSSTENQLMWMKLNCDVSENPHIHDAGIAYLSDSTLIDHITLPHGKRWQDSDFDGTSLDHAMWFHQTVRADEWLLFDQKVEWTGDGRGVASGRIYTENGALAATCMQEGLMRFGSTG
ncbi:MAG: thioesterase family protein [Gammaproteobacteria bacterium]|nr:thioesterase family protein [Gammaproteobacteria bacterium]